MLPKTNDRKRSSNSAMDVVILFLCMCVVVVGSTIPSGLYAIYQQQWELTASTMSAIFACYVLGVIITLPISGKFIKQFGWYKLAQLSLAIGLLSSCTFLFASGTTTLLIARLFSGISVGLCAGSFTLGLQDVTRNLDRGSLLSSVSTSTALAIGPVSAGMIAGGTEYPLSIPFALHAGSAILGLVALRSLRQSPKNNLTTKPTKSTIEHSENTRENRAVLAMSTIMFYCYGTNGLFQVIIPLYIASLYETSTIVAAFLPSLMLGVSAICQLLGRKFSPTKCCFSGLGIGIFCFAAFSLIEAQINYEILTTLTILIGISNGLVFRGSLSLLTQKSSFNHLPKNISIYYIFGYGGTALTSLLAGYIGNIQSLNAGLITGSTILTLFAVAGFLLTITTSSTNSAKRSRCD